MENKKNDRSVKDTKYRGQSYGKRQGQSVKTKIAGNKPIRQEKKQSGAPGNVSDIGKETKKQYINKPSVTRKVTVDRNQKLGKDGRLNLADTASVNNDKVKKARKTKETKETKKIKENKEKKTVKKIKKPIKPKSAAFPTFLLFVISLIVLIGTVSLCIPFIVLPKSEKKITLQYNLYGEKTKKNLTSGQVLKDGKNVYLCINDFSEQIGLHILGNEENARLYTDEGDTVSIENGSNRVLINGISFELSGNVIIEGRNIYVPATLLYDFTSGLDITYNFSTGKMNVSTIKDDDRSTSINTVYKDFFFTPHEVVPHLPLDN